MDVKETQLHRFHGHHHHAVPEIPRLDVNNLVEFLSGNKQPWKVSFEKRARSPEAYPVLAEAVAHMKTKLGTSIGSALFTTADSGFKWRAFDVRYHWPGDAAPRSSYVIEYRLTREPNPEYGAPREEDRYVAVVDKASRGATWFWVTPGGKLAGINPRTGDFFAQYKEKNPIYRLWGYLDRRVFDNDFESNYANVDDPLREQRMTQRPGRGWGASIDDQIMHTGRKGEQPRKVLAEVGRQEAAAAP